MKKILYILLSIALFFNLSVTAYARDFISLTEQEKESYMESLTKQVIRDLGLTDREIRIEFYNAPEWYEVASNTALVNTKWDTIRYNMAYFNTTEEADIRGETMEHFVRNIVAHEVRHSYQLVHMNDPTPYGEAVKVDKYNNTFEFLESDSKAYGTLYADGAIIYTANDGMIFDPSFYAETYSDVKAVYGTDPNKLLNHYNTYGIFEHRKPNKYVRDN